MENVNSLKFNSKELYKELTRIAFPIIIQQLIIVAVNLADTIMVGNVSEYALAAVGAANQIYFIVIDCIFGFLSGCAVYAVQYWGIKDLASLRRIMGISYLMIILFTIPVTGFVYLMAPKLIRIYSKDLLVISLGTDYIRIACFTYIIGGLSYIISYYSRSTEMLKWPTIFNAIAILLNVFLNWCLIYGNLGFNRLEVKGAAYATLIARIVECILLFTYVYLSKEHPLKAKLEELKFDKNLFNRVIKTAFPVIINELLWVLSFSFTFAIYGKIDAIALAIVEVSLTINDLFQCVYLGLGNACSVCLGKALGRGERENAYIIAKKCIKICIYISVITTTLLIIFRGPIGAFYHFQEDTFIMLKRTLIVFAISMTPKMLAYLIICGIIRPGGDTIWCFFVDAGLNWVVQVPLAFLAVDVLGLTIEYAIALVAMSDLIKTIVCYIRFKSKKWINVFTGR